MSGPDLGWIERAQAVGMSRDDIQTYLDAWARPAPSVDGAAEKRRAWDRDRKRNSTGNSTGMKQTNSTGVSTGIPPETASYKKEDIKEDRRILSQSADHNARAAVVLKRKSHLNEKEAEIMTSILLRGAISDKMLGVLESCEGKVFGKPEDQEPRQQVHVSATDHELWKACIGILGRYVNPVSNGGWWFDADVVASAKQKLGEVAA